MSVLTKINKLPSVAIIIHNSTIVPLIIIIFHIPMYTHKLRIETWKI